MAERIQLSRRRGWRKPDGAIVVARPSWWGNPYRIAQTYVVWTDRATAPMPTYREPGPFNAWATIERCEDRSTAVAWFRLYVHNLLETATDRDRNRARLGSLSGHDLACWCPVDEPCHADVLLELANRAEPAV